MACGEIRAKAEPELEDSDTDLVEYLTGSPFIDDLVEGRWKLDSEGMLPVPDGAGLGIALNMDAVEKHTGQRFGPASMSA